MRNRIKWAVMKGLLIAMGIGADACLSSPGRACGDGWCPEEYLCTLVNAQQSRCAAPGVCGNGITDDGEQCDDGNNLDGDACEANCSLPFCGNGIVDAGEQCDDRNTTNLDGCSSTCKREAREVEPNDFTERANGPFTDSIIIPAAISPAGDKDVFKFTNQSASSVLIQFDTWSLNFGIGVPCGDDYDTYLKIHDATGRLLGEDDDRPFLDRCSTVQYQAAAGETIYVNVMEVHDDRTISGYFLIAAYRP